MKESCEHDFRESLLITNQCIKCGTSETYFLRETCKKLLDENDEIKTILSDFIKISSMDIGFFTNPEAVKIHNEEYTKIINKIIKLCSK